MALVTNPIYDLSGYWVGMSNNEEQERKFLVYRANTGEYISLHQFIQNDVVKHWQIHFGHWELTGHKLKVRHVGFYNADELRTYACHKMPVDLYTVHSLRNGKMIYKSEQSGEVYAANHTNSLETLDKLSAHNVKVFKKGIKMHSEECQNRNKSDAKN